MLNAVNRITCFLCSLAAILMFASCGESKEAKEAKEMLAQASLLIDEGNYEDALAVIDTIPVLYPRQVKVRQSALDLKPVAIEMLADKELQECQEEILRMQQEFESAKSKMKRIDNPELVEGYWLPEGLDATGFMSSTGIQPRVNDDGSFGIISEVNGAGNLHHGSFTLTAPDGDTASSGTMAFDNELNYRIGNSETVTYTEEKVDTIGRFAMKHYGEKLELTFNGENGKTRKIKLTEKETNAIADAYDMSLKQKEGKALVARSQLLERRRELAREQQARKKQVSK